VQGGRSPTGTGEERVLKAGYWHVVQTPGAPVLEMVWSGSGYVTLSLGDGRGRLDSSGSRQPVCHRMG